MVITPWFIGWSNGVLPVAEHDFSVGSWGLLIKLVADGVLLNEENFEVHDLFLTAFPKVWHHVGTPSVCVVTWAFQLFLRLVERTYKILCGPGVLTAMNKQRL